MNIKRAVMIGVVLWVVLFFEVSVLMFGFDITNETLYYAIHYTLAAVFVIISSLFYFKKGGGGFKEGIILGVVFVLAGLVLDAAVTVPLFVKDYSQFFNLSLFIGYLETIAVTAIFGALKRKE